MDRSRSLSACGNEWVHGLCRKPTIKYNVCLNQAEVLLSEYYLLTTR